MKFNKFFLIALGCLALTACENPNDNDDDGGGESGAAIESGEFSGAYILNEGGWGMNEARIDQLDFTTGTYKQDVYVQANPSTVLALGDVGNDLQLHDQRLYAVINGSHKVEVMNAADMKRIGQIDISSPRAIAFTNTHGYVTSYVDGENDNGSIVEFDLETLNITRTVSVGQEPEGLAISNGIIYVANSGGYHAPNYADEVWCVSISDFNIIHKIKVAPNLHRLAAAADGSIWVNSRGNYYDVSSGLYRIKDGKVKSANVACAGFTITADKVLYYSSEWSYETNSNSIAYGTLDATNMTPGESFIKDGTETDITVPYGIFAADDLVFVTDAKNYTTSGAVHVYDSTGKRINQYSAGVCPNAIVFIPKN